VVRNSPSLLPIKRFSGSAVIQHQSGAKRAVKPKKMTTRAAVVVTAAVVVADIDQTQHRELQ
jgi:hypothetical protein